VSVDVSVVRCAQYDRVTTGAAVAEAVGLLGGIRAFIRPGDRVLLKPNLLKARPPEDAVTTHPEIVRAVIRLVREADGIPLVGDSPGIGDLRSVSERAGILGVVKEEGAAFADFDTAVAVKNGGRFQRLEIARAAVEADAIINLPKLKTHGMTVLTGAVKNLFGCVPGKRKVQWHFNTGVDHRAFARLLVELSAAVKPRLTIMDAVVAMEGNGPGSGDPRTVGLLLAGRDPVAVDVIAADIVGLQPAQLPVIRAAMDAGIGEVRPDRIRVLGEPLDAVRVRNFIVPPREHTEWQLPEWSRRLLKDALTTRPVIDHGVCIQCGICQKDCPRQAIAEQDGHLVIDHRNCIRCFCCQEFCPQGAITVGKGWLLRLARP
jgi:uncharacterized protein (DUF362 family)/Pyruvate/2-oxoacid:ferredoxin oxidoreductase delta subunit